MLLSSGLVAVVSADEKVIIMGLGAQPLFGDIGTYIIIILSLLALIHCLIAKLFVSSATRKLAPMVA